MTPPDHQKLIYPIGKFSVPDSYTPELRSEYTNTIQSLPKRLKEATQGLSDEQLDKPYREGGWSIRQITHHLADSHINSFTRFKLALTEVNPSIKPYNQDAWIDGPDASLPIEASQSILDGLHARLSYLMKNMTTEDYSRTLFHPEYKKSLPLDMMAALYSWHSNHHLAQVVNMVKREGWQ